MVHYIYDNIYVEDDGGLYTCQNPNPAHNRVMTKKDVQEIENKIDMIVEMSSQIVSKAELSEVQEVADLLYTKAEKTDVDIIKLKLAKVKVNAQGDVGINIDPIAGRGAIQIGSPRDDSNNQEPKTKNDLPILYKGNNSLYCSEKIVCQDMVNFSDERIKTNIKDITDDEALYNLRKINPKKFEYIDKMNRGASPTLGFIAQEVKTVMPDSVQVINEFIPNIYATASVNRNVLSLQPRQDGTNYDISVQDHIKIITSNTQLIVQVISVSVDKRIIVVDRIIEENTGWVFIYGKMVHDFLTINLDSIFTLNVCATQQIDKKVQDLEQQLAEMKLKLEQRDKTLSVQVKAEPNEIGFQTVNRQIVDMIDFHVMSQFSNFIYKPTQDVYITPDTFGKITINWKNSDTITKTYKINILFK
jgi:hypothetical protein